MAIAKKCFFCGAKDREMTRDHLIPKANAVRAGGIVTACMPCNRLKGAMMPTEFLQLARDIVMVTGKREEMLIKLENSLVESHENDQS